MFFKQRMILIVLAMISLFGCSGMNNQDVGTLTGGAIGGLVGSRFGSGVTAAVATGVGVLAGAYLGSRIGKNMDEVDRMKVSNTLERARTGQTSSWTNPDTGAQYAVTPTRTYKRRVGATDQPCREFTTTAIIGGKQEKIYGKACRMADGSWKIVE